MVDNPVKEKERGFKIRKTRKWLPKWPDDRVV
jgi:hypothetical protein